MVEFFRLIVAYADERVSQCRRRGTDCTCLFSDRSVGPPKLDAMGSSWPGSVAVHSKVSVVNPITLPEV